MATRFVRDWFTGKLKEVESEGGGRRIIARTSVPEGAVTKKNGSVWGRAWRSEAAGVPIEEIDYHNEQAKKHGTGARYVPGKHGYADLECDSKRSREREIIRRGGFDRDVGFTGAQPGRYKYCQKSEDSGQKSDIVTPKAIRQAHVDRHDRTHWEGCELAHPQCAIAWLLRKLEDHENEIDALYATIVDYEDMTQDWEDE